MKTGRFCENVGKPTNRPHKDASGDMASLFIMLVFYRNASQWVSTAVWVHIIVVSMDKRERSYSNIVVGLCDAALSRPSSTAISIASSPAACCHSGLLGLAFADLSGPFSRRVPIVPAGTYAQDTVPDNCQSVRSARTRVLYPFDPFSRRAVPAATYAQDTVPRSRS